MKGMCLSTYPAKRPSECHTKHNSLPHPIFSVVEFASLSDMKTAIEKLDDTELNGRRVRLVEDRRGGRSGENFCFFFMF